MTMMNLFESENSQNFTSSPKTTKYDLPDADVTLIENFFTTQESSDLITNLINDIAWQQHAITIFGKKINQPRLTAFYGDQNKIYSYSRLVMNPMPWNEDLLFIKSRIESYINIKFTSVLLNYYRNGNDSMGWHADDEKELGINPVIGSVSFGQTRTFQLKHIKRKDIKKVDMSLSNGSLLLMKGTTQHFWQHQIPKTSKFLDARINLTFRVIQ